LARRISTFAALVLATLCIGFLAGCQTVASPVMGLWMQNVGAPIDAGTKVGDRMGKSCATSYLGVFAMGDASIKAAAAAGGIKTIDSVDAEISSWIVIGQFCTVVRGS